MKYFDLKQYWKRVKLCIQDAEAQRVLVHDMHKYRWGCNRKSRFTAGMTPMEADSSDWLCEWICENGYRQYPAYFNYCCHGACFWLVNFNLRVASLVLPDKPWHIVESLEHATVWDGDRLLFEFNYQAFGIPASKCFETAYAKERCGSVLPVGKYRKVYCAEHWRRAA